MNTIKCSYTNEWCSENERDACQVKACEAKCGIKSPASCKACSDVGCSERIPRNNGCLVCGNTTFQNENGTWAAACPGCLDELMEDSEIVTD